MRVGTLRAVSTAAPRCDWRRCEVRAAKRCSEDWRYGRSDAQYGAFVTVRRAELQFGHAVTRSGRTKVRPYVRPRSTPIGPSNGRSAGARSPAPGGRGRPGEWPGPAAPTRVRLRVELLKRLWFRRIPEIAEWVSDDDRSSPATRGRSGRNTNAPATARRLH